MNPRAAIVALLLLGAAAGINRSSIPERVPLREPLAGFPMEVEGWRGGDTAAFDQGVLTVLGVDEYLNRVYVTPDHEAAGFYVGYYQSQRQGDTIHSPLNCLPGAGWEPVTRERVAIPVGASSVVVNRLTIEKGGERQVVLYWYQGHGRIVASEYWGKLYTVLDAIRTHRTDAALVRIIVPVRREGANAAATARQAATRFAEAVLPLLKRYLPA